MKEVGKSVQSFCKFRKLDRSQPQRPHPANRTFSYGVIRIKAKRTDGNKSGKEMKRLRFKIRVGWM